MAARQDHRILTYVTIGLSVIGVLLSFDALVHAHGILIRSVPPVNSTVAESPSEIRLWFNESIERRFSRVTVERVMRHPSTGEFEPEERVDTQISDGPSVTRELAVALPKALPKGTYRVKWKVLSIDSHRTTGQFTIDVGAKAAGSNPSPAKN